MQCLAPLTKKTSTKSKHCKWVTKKKLWVINFCKGFCSTWGCCGLTEALQTQLKGQERAFGRSALFPYKVTGFRLSVISAFLWVLYGSSECSRSPILKGENTPIAEKPIKKSSLQQLARFSKCFKTRYESWQLINVNIYCKAGLKFVKVWSLTRRVCKGGKGTQASKHSTSPVKHCNGIVIVHICMGACPF